MREIAIVGCGLGPDSLTKEAETAIRQVNLVDSVRRNRQCFCLTGNNVTELANSLVEAGFSDLQVFVGENLGTKAEDIYETTVKDLAGVDYPPLTVLLIINESFSAGSPTGLKDESFARLASIPMTKAETRALLMSKLRLKPDDTVWDIGAATGSVTVEMALSVYRGRVFALERREEALPLIKENLRRFHLGNVSVISAEAPAGLAGKSHLMRAENPIYIFSVGGDS